MTAAERIGRAGGTPGGAARPRVYLLIGPKGSGKTYIGRLIESRLGIPFLPVEQLALRVRGDRAVDDASYVEEVFRAIGDEVLRRLASQPEVVLESTGLSDPFDGMLARLRERADVVLIGVTADPARCLSRVRSRDRAEHVDVSDQQVEAINAAVLGRSHPFAGTIDNDCAAPGDLVRTFLAIRRRAGA